MTRAYSVTPDEPSVEDSKLNCGTMQTSTEYIICYGVLTPS